MGQLPTTVNLPLFTGENPQLWKTLYEQYFQMFLIHNSYRVPMATLNFSGPPGIWLQYVQKKTSRIGLGVLCLSTLHSFRAR